MKMDAASLLVLFSLIGLLEANVCHSEEEIWPCKCSSKSGPHLIEVECTHIRKPEELISPMRALERSKTEVWKLTIKDSSLFYLPDNLFKNVNIQEVWFMNMNITALSELQTAFYGLENSLISIIMDMVTFPAGFHFDTFRNLKKLKGIIFYECNIQAVIHHLPHLPSVAHLKISGSRISFIPSKAFSDLPDLFFLDLNDNNITGMKRSMLPNPANKLAQIHLRNNLLTSLPKDFFENMPNLEYVHLGKNKFKILSEKPFSGALKNRELQTFDMSGNPLHCDCTLSWLEGIRFPKRFIAMCSSPEAHQGKSVEKLDFESFRLQKCYA